MKFVVSMKDPDVLENAIRDAVKSEMASVQGLDDEEREAASEVRREKVSELCARWFEYGEYLVVEIDTEAETITVCPA
jgi:hypothetical protein